MNGKELVDRIVHEQTGFIHMAASMAQYTRRYDEYLVNLSTHVSEDQSGELTKRLGGIVPLLAQYMKDRDTVEELTAANLEGIANELARPADLSAEKLCEKFTDNTTGLIQFAANRAEETGTQLQFLEAMRDQYLPEPVRMREKIGIELCLDLEMFFDIPKAGA